MIRAFPGLNECPDLLVSSAEYRSALRTISDANGPTRPNGLCCAIVSRKTIGGFDGTETCDLARGPTGGICFHFCSVWTAEEGCESQRCGCTVAGFDGA